MMRSLLLSLAVLVCCSAVLIVLNGLAAELHAFDVPRPKPKLPKKPNPSEDVASAKREAERAVEHAKQRREEAAALAQQEAERVEQRRQAAAALAQQEAERAEQRRQAAAALAQQAAPPLIPTSAQDKPPTSLVLTSLANPTITGQKKSGGDDSESDSGEGGGGTMDWSHTWHHWMRCIGVEPKEKSEREKWEARHKHDRGTNNNTSNQSTHQNKASPIQPTQPNLSKTGQPSISQAPSTQSPIVPSTLVNEVVDTWNRTTFQFNYQVQVGKVALGTNNNGELSGGLETPTWIGFNIDSSGVSISLNIPVLPYAGKHQVDKESKATFISCCSGDHYAFSGQTAKCRLGARRCGQRDRKARLREQGLALDQREAIAPAQLATLRNDPRFSRVCLAARLMAWQVRHAVKRFGSASVRL